MFTAKVIFVILLLGIAQVNLSSALLYIVRQSCVKRSIFTPAPSTVNNICLQCLCIADNLAYCKPIIVQLSVICSAALSPTIAPVPAAATTTRAPLTIPTMPPLLIPTVAATTTVTIPPPPTPAQTVQTTTRPLVVSTAAPTPATTVGINPRASSPAAPSASDTIPGMMSVIPANMMINTQPMMMSNALPAMMANLQPMMVMMMMTGTTGMSSMVGSATPMPSMAPAPAG